MMSEAILAGIIGTSVMTVYVYLIAWITGARLGVIHILASVLNERPGIDYSTKHLIVAGFVHYLIGVLFALTYLQLVVLEVASIATVSAIIYGLLIGSLAVLVWRLTFALRGKPAEVPLKTYLLSIGSGHIVFSLTIIQVFEYWT